MGYHLLRAVPLAWEGGPGWIPASVPLVALRGLLPLASLSLMKLFVDAVAGGVTASDKGAALGSITPLVVLSAAVALIGSALSTVAGFVSTGQAQAVTNHIYDVLHAKSVEVDLPYYENPKYYDTLHRAQQIYVD
jgi:ATP-binding cassette, subfamily B, bacterial